MSVWILHVWMLLQSQGMARNNPCSKCTLANCKGGLTLWAEKPLSAVLLLHQALPSIKDFILHCVIFSPSKSHLSSSYDSWSLFTLSLQDTHSRSINTCMTSACRRWEHSRRPGDDADQAGKGQLVQQARHTEQTEAKQHCRLKTELSWTSLLLFLGAGNRNATFAHSCSQLAKIGCSVLKRCRWRSLEEIWSPLLWAHSAP